MDGDRSFFAQVTLVHKNTLPERDCFLSGVVAQASTILTLRHNLRNGMLNWTALQSHQSYNLCTRTNTMSSIFSLIFLLCVCARLYMCVCVCVCVCFLFSVFDLNFILLFFVYNLFFLVFLSLSFLLAYFRCVSFIFCCFSSFFFPSLFRSV